MGRYAALSLVGVAIGVELHRFGKLRRWVVATTLAACAAAFAFGLQVSLQLRKEVSILVWQAAS